MSNEATYKTVLNTLKEFEPSYVAVFGSRARGDHRPDSDLDLLVEFDAELDLIQIIGVEQELTKILGYPVQLVSKAYLSEYLKPYVEKDLIVLLND